MKELMGINMKALINELNNIEPNNNCEEVIDATITLIDNNLLNDFSIIRANLYLIDEIKERNDIKRLNEEYLTKLNRIVTVINAKLNNYIKDYLELIIKCKNDCKPKELKDMTKEELIEFISNKLT